MKILILALSISFVSCSITIQSKRERLTKKYEYQSHRSGKPVRNDFNIVMILAAISGVVFLKIKS